MPQLPIQLPWPLKELLDQEPELSSQLHPFLKASSALLVDNALTFFPSFTNHGVDHVVDILHTARKLIPDSVWNASILSPADAACLLVATILHDIGMHLSATSFIALIEPEEGSSTPIVASERFGDHPWRELWEDFLREASRFDDRMLNLIWGLPEDEGQGLRRDRCVQRPPRDPRDWTLDNKLLVGEFIRRHHPRIAHEVALRGIPGVAPQHFPILADSLPTKYSGFADLIGVIARSHGMDLRRCHADVEYRYPKTVRPFGTIPLYHMALLRVADFLQIHSDRAPAVLLHLKRPQSPVSMNEWKRHAAVLDIDWNHRDTSAFYVRVDPKVELRTLLQLRELLERLQHELDHSAAVLNEVFSRLTHDHLHLLGLDKARVDSDLDNPTFLASLPYDPHFTGFSTSAPELLKLLIKPLYADHPEVGIRELMQNSVDAVRELRQYIENHPEKQGVFDQASQDVDVLISVEQDSEGQWWCRCTDKGIGMTPDIVREYFLRAGACFRDSNAWQREFVGPTGEARVLRSGRFGVGAFATFLLGDVMEVSTRHVSAKTGVQFRASLDCEIIELYRTSTIPVGTEVRIAISPEMYDRLKKKHGVGWDWYRLAYPTVHRQVLDDETKLSSQPLIPSHGKSLPAQWHRLTDPDYQDVLWTYASGPRVICNGIVISDSGGGAYSHTLNWGTGPNVVDMSIPLNVPNVAVVDLARQLPLDLQRYGLVNHNYPFHDSLICDVTKDLCAYSITHAPTRPPFGIQPPSFYFRGYPGLHRNEWQLFNIQPFGRLAHSSDGTCLIDPWYFNKAGFRHLLIVIKLTSRLDPIPFVSMEHCDALVYAGIKNFHPEMSIPLAIASAIDRHNSEQLPDFFDLVGKRAGSRVLLSSALAEGLRGSIHGNWNFTNISEESLNSGLVLWETGKCQPLSSKEPWCGELIEWVRASDYVVCEWFYDDGFYDRSESLFNRTLEEVMPHSVVPYKEEGRAERFGTARQKLSAFIDKWTEIGGPETVRHEQLFMPEIYHRRMANIPPQ